MQDAINSAFSSGLAGNVVFGGILVFAALAIAGLLFALAYAVLHLGPSLLQTIKGSAAAVANPADRPMAEVTSARKGFCWTCNKDLPLKPSEPQPATNGLTAETLLSGIQHGSQKVVDAEQRLKFTGGREVRQSYRVDETPAPAPTVATAETAKPADPVQPASTATHAPAAAAVPAVAESAPVAGAT